jgi:NifU-like protein
MWEYTDKVKDHFLNPRNVGVIEDADGVGEVGSIACGDALSFYFKLDEDGRIQNANVSDLRLRQRHRLLIGSDRNAARQESGRGEKITNRDIAGLPGRTAQREDALLGHGPGGAGGRHRLLPRRGRDEAPGRS